MLQENNLFRPRLPGYLKQTLPHGSVFNSVQQTLQQGSLNTVCEEAKCPNRTHCYNRGTLAFQILGNICTRSCGFCAEKFGQPETGGDPDEPRRVAEAVGQLNLNHVVITSPARDDLEDDGASQFAAVIQEIHRQHPAVTIEVLTPDFRGKSDCLTRVFEASPNIFNHNIETVRRLTSKVRSKATYDRTLSVLKQASQAGLLTKSGFMVGHGEEREEIFETLLDLRDVGVHLLTIGQYLPPSSHHLPLQRIYLPEEFEDLKNEALSRGFGDVASGPLVRSSFHAEEMSCQPQL